MLINLREHPNIDSKKDLGNLYVSPVNNKHTLLFVTPFFGNASGINSYAKMETLTDQIKQYSEEFFKESVLSSVRETET